MSASKRFTPSPSGLELALAAEGPPPRVVVCGGLHFAGEVLALSPETWPT